MNVPSRLPRLMTVEETAEVLQQSTKTVRRKITAGAIPITRLGRSIRIAQADLLAYLAAARQVTQQDRKCPSKSS